MNIATAEAWKQTLSTRAAGLDLTDSEDRAVYRQRVACLCRNTKLSMINDVAALYGAHYFPTRAGAIRALSNAAIEMYQ